MAVTVTITDQDNGGNYTEISHAAASGVDVKDGHLLVTRPSSVGGYDNVAVYAPGKWHNAAVVISLSRA